MGMSKREKMKERDGELDVSLIIVIFVSFLVFARRKTEESYFVIELFFSQHDAHVKGLEQ